MGRGLWIHQRKHPMHLFPIPLPAHSLPPSSPKDLGRGARHCVCNSLSLMGNFPLRGRRKEERALWGRQAACSPPTWSLWAPSHQDPHGQMEKLRPEQTVACPNTFSEWPGPSIV